MELLKLWKEKRELREVKRESKKLLEKEYSHSIIASVRWSNMLYKKKKVEVLEANSSEELNEKWKNFTTQFIMEAVDSDHCGHLMLRIFL
ncbi:hypothetical protein [Paenibacillus sp. 1A_MP2]|uniref:hypothetical protein n=1 Tax=Paenibacillus sp. 1A_MP2 TaxID=3457495 RepID=UPI003FCCC4C1